MNNEEPGRAAVIQATAGEHDRQAADNPRHAMEATVVSQGPSKDPLRATEIGKAAWQFEDSMQERILDDYPSEPQAREMFLEVVAAGVNYNKALLGMVALSVFETPSWCDSHSELFWTNSTRCHIEDWDLLLSGIPYIPPGWGLLLEVYLIHVIYTKISLERRLQVEFFEPKKLKYFNMGQIYFGLVMLAFELVDCLFFLIFQPRWRLAFIARAGYLALLPGVQKLCKCILACLGEFFSVAVFLAGFIVFFAWITLSVFSDFDDEAKEGFTSFPEALNSMFIAGVCDEFVAVMIKSYTAYRWVGIMWLLFLMVVHVLLLSLVLDTLTAAYMNYSERVLIEEWKNRVRGMRQAFKTLSDATRQCATADDEVDELGFLEFIQEFSRSPKVNAISQENAKLLFQCIDQDGSGSIEMDEFCDVCGIIQFQFWTTRKDSVIKTCLPDVWNSPWHKKFRDYVEAGDFDKFMSYVLLVNLALVLIETVYDQNKWDEPPLLDWLEFVFSFVYLGEVGANLGVISFPEYWSSRSNQFDFFTTWLLLCTSLIERSPFVDQGTLSTYANMLRLLRLLRVVKQLKNLPEVQFMIRTVTKIVNSSKDMMTLLGVVIFFFTGGSVQAWGGLLYQNNTDLEETEYLEQHLTVLNCNDFPCAFGIWVVSLLQEYQPAFTDAVAKVETIRFSWMAFPVFWLIGVSIVFELVKAFTIEVFMGLKAEQAQEKRNEQAQEQEQRELEEMMKDQRCGIVAGIAELEDKKNENKDQRIVMLEECAKAFREEGHELHWRVVGDMPTGLIEEAKEALEKEEEEEEKKRKKEESR